jgi:hypothetical protein
MSDPSAHPYKNFFGPIRAPISFFWRICWPVFGGPIAHPSVFFGGPIAHPSESFWREGFTLPQKVWRTHPRTHQFLAGGILVEFLAGSLGESLAASKSLAGSFGGNFGGKFHAASKSFGGKFGSLKKT